MAKKISSFLIMLSVFFWVASAVSSVTDLEIGDFSFLALLLGVGVFIMDEISSSER